MNTDKHISDKLLDDLINQRVIKLTMNDRAKAQQIIRHYFVGIFQTAVEQTFLATNKKQYQEPKFED